MDDLDRRLISALRIDGRAPLSKLATMLGVSRGTVQNRLDRLVETKEIAGFTVRVRSDLSGDRVSAVMMIEVEGKNTRRVVQSLKAMPGIKTLYSTNGAFDLVAEIEVATLLDFDRVLYDVRMIDGISRTETSLLLAPA
ncbi:Lrp/AsnC family transcriptional regulator [Mesorhizobium sp. CGMCC 1.15528]|uniref:Lrp/AsnC family transcriptional regulator n=1 Tax=Mesorhizobium zhangyense TaxID=1776730 RepID=A0A7C9VB37_9HYPH|nr:Lrp/AsnC family transcriptional regulator [Mesorhizobium zhangyense]NGN41109.1 Lrp/AsnC family transcriptional regulator [Mesorhizobium zhangyense]